MAGDADRFFCDQSKAIHNGPRRVEVPRPEFRRAWHKLLNELNIECRVTYQPQPVSQLLEGMADLVAAQRLPRLADDFDARDLPPGDATWQIDFFHQPDDDHQRRHRRSASLVGVGDGQGRPVTCCVPKLFRANRPRNGCGSTPLRVMLQVSGRPRRIEVSDSDGYDFLRPRLAAGRGGMRVVGRVAGVALVFCLQMASSFGGPEKCGPWADGQDVDRDGMESFYYAAARYFRQAPWKHVPGEIPIEIKVTGFAARYAIVLGRTGGNVGPDGA